MECKYCWHSCPSRITIWKFRIRSFGDFHPKSTCYHVFYTQKLRFWWKIKYALFQKQVISRTFSRHGDTLGFSEEHMLLQPDCIKLCTYIAHAVQSTCFYLKLYTRRQGACHRIQTDTRLCAAVVFSWQTSSGTIRGYSGLFKSVLRIWIRIRMYWASWIQIH